MSRGRGLCPGGEVYVQGEGSLSKGSLSGRRPPQYAWVVHILLTCILVLQFFAENCIKMKEFGPASLAPPSDPPMNVNST